MSIQDCPLADAIVVLGGDAPRRFEPALDLALAGKAPLLIILNTGRQSSNSEMGGEQLRYIALSRGLPGDRILVTRIVHSTFDESIAVAAIVRAKQLSTIILVTSAHQMLRATYLFRRAGISLFPFPVNFSTCPGEQIRSLRPGKEAFWRSRLVLHEYIGLASAAIGIHTVS